MVQRAATKVKRFKALHKRPEKKIIVSGKSLSTLNNHMRCIAHVALYFNLPATGLTIEQIDVCLLMVKKRNTTSSESFFKHTFHGLRSLFRVEGRDDRAIRLPSIRFSLDIISTHFTSTSHHFYTLLCSPTLASRN